MPSMARDRPTLVSLESDGRSPRAAHAFGNRIWRRERRRDREYMQERHFTSREGSPCEMQSQKAPKPVPARRRMDADRTQLHIPGDAEAFTAHSEETASYRISNSDVAPEWKNVHFIA